MKPHFQTLHPKSYPQTQVAPSRSERIVGVMRELHRRRQRSDVFAGRHAFITPRDLFRHTPDPAQRTHSLHISSQTSSDEKTLTCPRKCRWAERAAASGTDSYTDVAREGYMLLAEGLRRVEDRDSLREVVEGQMKAKVGKPPMSVMSPTLSVSPDSELSLKPAGRYARPLRQRLAR